MHGGPVVAVLVLGVGYGYLAERLAIDQNGRLVRLELHVTIHPVVEVLAHLLLLVLDDGVFELSLISPTLQMLLLFVLVDDVAAHLAFG